MRAAQILGWDIERVLEADGAFVQSVLRVGDVIEKRRLHALTRAIKAALGSDAEYEQDMETAVLGAVQAERNAALRKGHAAADKYEGLE